jgi:hypothetical protein
MLKISEKHLFEVATCHGNNFKELTLDRKQCHFPENKGPLKQITSK